MTKVLVCDYDKTFYLNDLDIIKNIKMVKQFRSLGNLFIIATGRSYYDFMKKKNKYNIEYDYVLLNHGATIIDNQDNVLYNYPINEDINSIKNNLELSKSMEYFCCSKLDSRVEFNHDNLTKIAVRYLPLVNIPKIKENLDSKFHNINCYLVSTNMLEIISNNIDKSKALKILINDLHIDKSQVYTIGDSYTDINMVRDFNGYCMKGSIQELRNVSQEEYKSVSELVKKRI